MPPKSTTRSNVIVGNQPTVEQLLPSTELLAYYKARVDDFDKERQGLIEALDKCSVQQAEVHQMEWENRKRAEEIRELQKALSDAHNFLFEERQRLLTLQAENDSLRLQEVQDRQRIQQLLSITQPLEQEITYNKQTGPNTMTLLPKRTPSGKPSSPTAAAVTVTRPSSRGEPQERVMRTVFLPTANADYLLLKVESLQAQVNEQKQLAAERVAALLEDRRIRAQEEEAHRAQLTATVEGLSARLKKAEEVLRTTTRDYILAKKAKEDAECRAVAADTAMVQERQRASEERTALRAAKEQELEGARKLADARLDEYVDKFRRELREREDELMALESVHNSAKAQYEGRVTDLTTKLKTLQKHYDKLEARRQADVEGFQADITALRRKLCEVDRKLHAMRLQERLHNDDRLDTILAKLKTRAPSTPATPLASREGLAATFSQEMATELNGIKDGLAHLDANLRSKAAQPAPLAPPAGTRRRGNGTSAGKAQQ